MERSSTFHPLEIIPFFRGFPCSPLRDFVYTFIWSSGFGVVFFVFGALSDPRHARIDSLAFYILISNAIGYAIHWLYRLGSRVGLEALARRHGFVTRVVYYSTVPIVGVVIGFAIATARTGANFGAWLSRPDAVASIVITSVILSTVLSVIF